MDLGNHTNDARPAVTGRRPPKGMGEGGQPGPRAVRRRAESAGPTAARGARRGRGDASAPIAPRRTGAGRNAACGGRPGRGHPVGGARGRQAEDLRPGAGAREGFVRRAVPRARPALGAPREVLALRAPHRAGGHPAGVDQGRGSSPWVSSRQPDRACVARRPRRLPVGFVPRPVLGRLDRFLAGLAVVTASATAVVLLGLLADLAAS
jgi:hypothetical protein